MGNRLDVLERHVSIDVACKDIDLLTTGLVVQQGIEIVFPVSQWLCTDDTHTIVFLTVKQMGLVLDEGDLFFRFIEAAGIVHPPVGLVLDGHCINIDSFFLHPV